MAILHIQHPWAFTFGLLGNLVSFMVIIAPIPTFYRIYKKKSTEGFQSLPYMVSLFSAMLWIYYGSIKVDGYLLITINTFACIVQTIYIVMYLVYAPRKAKIWTAKLVLSFNIGVFSLILLLTLWLVKGANRVRIIGWVCMAFSVGVFVAPLSIMRLVISTKSVEFMPFNLSFCLTLSAIMWFFYGLLMKDLYIALPNVLGFLFGIIQMILYRVYKDPKKVKTEMKLPADKIVKIIEEKLPEQVVNIVMLTPEGSSEVLLPDPPRNCRLITMEEEMNQLEVIVHN